MSNNNEGCSFQDEPTQNMRVVRIPEISEYEKRRLSRGIDFLHSGVLEESVELEDDTSDSDVVNAIEAQLVSQSVAEVDRFEGGSSVGPEDAEARKRIALSSLGSVLVKYAEDPYTLLAMLQGEIDDRDFDMGFDRALEDERCYSPDSAPLVRDAAERLALGIVDNDLYYRTENEWDEIASKERFDELLSAGDKGLLYSENSLTAVVESFECTLRGEHHGEDRAKVLKRQNEFKRTFGIDMVKVHKLYEDHVGRDFDKLQKVIHGAQRIVEGIDRSVSHEIMPQIGSRLKALMAHTAELDRSFGDLNTELIARAYVAALWIEALEDIKIKD